MNSPLFSILVANYNNSQYLNECIGSVINQSYKCWELIFIDDCSTDNSIEIMNSFASKDSRIKVFKNEANKGCAYTKARCVKESQGELCGFLDSDDALMPSAIEKMVFYHLQQPECSLISSRFFQCNKNLKIRLLSVVTKKSNFTSYLCTPRLTHFNTFKRVFYDKTSGISEEYRLGVDQDLCVKLEEVGKIGFISDVLYKYREYNSSISHFGNSKAKFYNLVIRIDACRRRNISVDCLQHLYKTTRKNIVHRTLRECVRKILFDFNLLRYFDRYKPCEEIEIFDVRNNLATGELL